MDMKRRTAWQELGYNRFVLFGRFGDFPLERPGIGKMERLSV